LYDQYGHEGVQAADQMGEDQAHAHFGGRPGRGGGMPFYTTHSSGGGPGGMHHMSPEEAQQFFSSFFGSSDPFGAFGGGGGMPGGMRNGGRGGQRIHGGGDPFNMMFGGGMPGGMGGMGGMPGMFDMNDGMGGGGGMPRRSAPVKRYDAIPNGTIVSLQRLQNQPDRNGDRGEIIQYDPASGRYTVQLEDSDECLRVKPHNLLQHIHVHVQGLTSQPELNGLQGTIIAWNEHKQRYSIYVMDRSKICSLKPQNVILESGTVAQITGLQSKPELNGKFGTIQGWIRDGGRYDVQLSASQIIRVKVENMRV
jgi:predicted transcriptional regulator